MARLYDIGLQINHFLVEYIKRDKAFNQLANAVKEFKKYKDGCLFIWCGLQETETDKIRNTVTAYSRMSYKMIIASVGNKDLNDSILSYGALQNHNLTFTLGAKKEDEVNDE